VWLVAVALIVVVFLALLSSLYALAVTGVPVVRTPAEFLAEITAEVSGGEGTTVVDAGCGDARALLAFCAAEGVTGRGYELNGPICLYGKARVLLSGRCERVKLHWGDFFRCELEDVDVVFCHLMPAVMVRVGAKCAQEMCAGARLVSFLWEVPGWVPSRVVKLGRREDPLFVYEIPPRCQENDRPDNEPKT
jgi:SAM-dependent methyltransferase